MKTESAAMRTSLELKKIFEYFLFMFVLTELQSETIYNSVFRNITITNVTLESSINNITQF